MSDMAIVSRGGTKVNTALLNKALVFICDRLREGTTLARCYEVWETWGSRGVKPEMDAWWNAIGAAITEIEAMQDVNALCCTEGSPETARLRAALWADAMDVNQAYEAMVMDVGVAA